MKIKAITLWEPWAILCVGGYKQYETRSWATTYRGLLAIHAAKQEPRECEQVWLEDHFRESLREMGYTGIAAHYLLPRGVIVGWVHLTAIYPAQSVVGSISDRDFAMGDYSKGRFAWKLENAYQLDEPVRASGRQGLWNWKVPPELERLITTANGE